MSSSKYLSGSPKMIRTTISSTKNRGFVVLFCFVLLVCLFSPPFLFVHLIKVH